MMSGTPVATIVITTRNRKEELRSALDSAFSQDVAVEVIVTDDASDDGTPQMVASDFPATRVLRSEQRLGYIAQRNRAAAAASCNIIFSLDDDAVFSSTDIVRKTLSEFTDTRVGAVAIPHVDTLSGSVVHAPAPDDGRIWCVAAYIGTAHAVRREVFLAIGGYREDLVHQGEESDFCMRMLAAGFITRLGRAPFIEHRESPHRNFARMDFHGRRNDLLFAWRHAPTARLIPHLVGTTLHGLRDAVQTGRWRSHSSGMVEGWRRIFQGSALRDPVAPGVYRMFRRLRTRGPQPLDEILPSLPPPSSQVLQPLEP